MKHVKLFIILNIIDFIITSYLISQHGYHIEANPLLRTLMLTADGIWPMALVKIFAISVIMSVYKISNDLIDPRFFNYSIILVNILFGCAVISGLLVMFGY